MRSIIITVYIFNLIFFLDSTLANPIFGNRTLSLYMYFAILAFFYFSHKLKAKKFEVEKYGIGFIISSPLIFIYIINLFRQGSSTTVILQILAFIFSIYLMSYFIGLYKLYKPFIWMTYFCSSLFIFFQFSKENYSLDVYRNLNTIFEEERFRLDFGFNQVNTAGNLSLCILLFSFFLLFSNYFQPKKILSKFIFFSSVLFLDFICITVLLSTGSRSSLVALISFCMCFLLYLFNRSIFLNERDRKIIETIIFLLTLFIAMKIMGVKLLDIFISSNRLNNVLLNLPILKSWKEWLFGIGVVSPGSSIYAGAGPFLYYVDNYYLYILLTIGIIGLLAVAFFFFSIGKKIIKQIKYSGSNIFIITFSIFIAHLVSGMGESSVIYYTFPSSMIYLMIYCIFGLQYSDEEEEIK